MPTQLETAKQSFQKDWNNLKLDNYLKDGARFRLRRFGYFYFLPSTEEILPFPFTPYFQDDTINSYAGGVQRKLAPLFKSTLTNKFLQALIKFDFEQFPLSREKKQQPWRLDLHQIRVIGTDNEIGEPTPEGIHHDENDFVCIHLMGRKNTLGGINTIYDNNKQPLKSVALQQTMDSIVIWDPHVMHSVSSVYPKNKNEKAIRDILIIGYSHVSDLKRP
ncbi:MAG: 2OG-Fe dioxygenase family protein [Methylococcales bacterium]|nr:2OG-Fe dioxygenase family protein [Methylococcales bacterium]